MYKWLINYHPDNYHPDNYWPGYEAVTPTTGGAIIRRRYELLERDRLREEEDLIMIMAGWLWPN